MVQLLSTFNYNRMHTEGAAPIGEVTSPEASVQNVKLRVQMQVMERLGFLQKPSNADDLETTPMTGEQIQAAFDRWEKFRFGPRFGNVFIRLYNGYHDDATGEYVLPVHDEPLLTNAITNVLREPPEVFQMNSTISSTIIE